MVLMLLHVLEVTAGYYWLFSLRSRVVNGTLSHKWQIVFGKASVEGRIVDFYIGVFLYSCGKILALLVHIAEVFH